MDNSKFNIFESVKNGYLFVGREWVYLAKAGILPVMLQICTSLFIQFQRPDSSLIEGYLWGMPATVLFAWFTFIEMRLLILGEKLDQLPEDVEYLVDRQRAMKLAVITSLLFNMGMSLAITILMSAAESPQWGTEWPITLAGMAMIGMMFWAVRFGLLPILAAVHYPFAPFLKKIRGMMFSLRLVGMGAVCLFPVAFLFQIFVVSFMGRSADPAVQLKMTAPEQTTIIIASAFLSLLITALLNAAAAHALKQLLGSNRSGVLV